MMRRIRRRAKRLRRSGALIGGAFAVAAGLGIVAPMPASAAPPPAGNPCQAAPWANWHFDGGSWDWSGAAVSNAGNAFRSAAVKWRNAGIRKFTGGDVAWTTEGGGLSAQWGQFVGSAAGKVGGFQNCGLILFNTDRAYNGVYGEGLLDTPGMLDTAARHELGHSMRLAHTGYWDSIDHPWASPTFTWQRPTPSMITCAVNMNPSRSLGDSTDVRADDRMAVTASSEGLTWGRHTVTNNAGFDNAPSNYIEGWDWASAAAGWVATGGGDSGPKIQYRWANSVNDNMWYQMSNMSKQVGVEKHVSARVVIKGWSASDQKYVRVGIWARQVDYGDSWQQGGGCSGQPLSAEYWNSRFLNVRSEGSWFECTGFNFDNNYIQPNSWSYWQTPACTIPSNWEGADLEIRLGSARVDSAGNPQVVEFSTLRLEVDQ